MKNTTHSLALLTLAGLLSASAVLHAQETSPKPTPPVAPSPAAPAAESPADAAWSWDELKAAEFEQRDAFIAQVRAMHAKFDAEVATLRSKFKETDATESEKKAMIELDKAEVDFEEKMKALDNVTADTWETVKSNLLSSWLNLQEAFKKARPTE